MRGTYRTDETKGKANELTEPENTKNKTEAQIVDELNVAPRRRKALITTKQKQKQAVVNSKFL